MDKKRYEKMSHDLSELVVIESKRICNKIDNDFMPVTKKISTTTLIKLGIKSISQKMTTLVLMKPFLEENRSGEELCDSFQELGALIYAMNVKEVDAEDEECIKIVYQIHEMFHKELYEVIKTICTAYGRGI